MADPFTIGLTVASAGSSILGGMAADKAAKKAAKEQAKMVGMQRAEEQRQRKAAARQQFGEAKATVAASNLQFSGSPRSYVQALDMENMREIAFARYAAKKEKEAILEGGEGAGTGMFYQAAGDLIGAAVGSMAGKFGGASGGAWGKDPGTVSDSFLNQGEAAGAFDESF